MIESITIPQAELTKLILIFFRMVGIVTSIPVIGGPQTPGKVKILLGIFATIIISKMVPDVQLPDSMLLIAGGVIQEIALGFFIGFFTKVMFGAIELAGAFIGFQMGLAMSNAFDPQSHSQISLIAQFQVVLASLIFLSLNMHHIFIMAAYKSFDLIPLMGIRLSAGLLDMMIDYSATMFITAIKISAPISVALILTNAVLALISKAVPRMNVFVVGFPLTISVGMIGLGITLPYFLYFLRQHLFVDFGEHLEKLLFILGS